MEKRRYKVTLVKYVRDAASCGVDQDSRRFSFDTMVRGTSRIAKRWPFASDIDQNALEDPSNFYMSRFFQFRQTGLHQYKSDSLCVSRNIDVEQRTKKKTSAPINFIKN